MLVRALLQTSLVLWLTQQTLQGGVKPQSVSWGRVMPARGVGMGPKPGGVGALGAVGNRYGSKAMKNGMGRYPGAQLGLGAYRNLGLGGKTGPKQGGYAAQGPYGANLGTGMGLGTGLTNGLGLGHAGKRMYGGGMGTLPGYGALGAGSYPAARQGYGGAGNYLGGNLGAGGYGAGPGQGAYLGGAAGKLAAGAAAALGQGYGDGVTGYMGPMGGNGYAGHGNGYGDGYGAALNTGAYAGQVQGAYGALGAGLDATGGKYGGAAQVPYGGAPVIPTGLEGDGGYPYGAQQLNLGGDGTKTASKHGYGPQLGVTQDALGDPAGKYGMGNGALGNGYKG